MDTEEIYHKFIETLEARCGDNGGAEYGYSYLRGVIYHMAYDVPRVTQYLKLEQQIMDNLNVMEGVTPRQDTLSERKLVIIRE